MLALSIIQYPNGNFGYVGTVPVDLAVECTEGKEDRAYFIACQVGMGMAKKIAEREGWSMKTRTFTTAEAAKDFANTKGYHPTMPNWSLV